MDDYVADQIIADKYRLVRRLGEGGMASVWLAHSEVLDIDVAIKFIRADIVHAELGPRLLQEARAAARLGHPAIVRVTDYGSTEVGDPFIVMELLTGEPLSTALQRRGRLSAVKAIRTLLPVVHALMAAHDKGIVHRDLKPENIFLVQNDDYSIQPKVVDFGIAKLDRKGFARLTNVGFAMGSPGYMSPEQARGMDVDSRADIWSICVVIYEAITGRPPFEGKSYNALLRSVIEDAPAPITTLAAGDDELWRVLEKGLAKDVDLRWQTMRELGVALAGWLLARGINDDITGVSLRSAWMSVRVRAGSTVPPDLATGLLGAIRTQLEKNAPKTPVRRKKAAIIGVVASAVAAAAMVSFLATRPAAPELMTSSTLRSPAVPHGTRARDTAPATSESVRAIGAPAPSRAPASVKTKLARPVQSPALRVRRTAKLPIKTTF